MPDRQRVLIVDDSTVYRRLLGSMLGKWGYEVLEAVNGEAALEVLATQRVNMVLSDWEMPVMDGLTLCQEIRARFQDHYIYLILLTARESVDDLALGFQAGADDFLSKPVNQSELRARLHAGERILELEATLAARNARLREALTQIESDLQAAAQLQRSVLPGRRMQYDNFFADWLFVPSAYVSGDIFNLFPLDRHLGFYCVDVAGHGVGAAMMSLAVARQFLHGRAVERFLFDGDSVTAPHNVIRILNERFCHDDTEIVSYFTMVYGVIDTETGEGTLCQAGHPTPFITHPDGTITRIGSGGAPVGLLAGLSWDETPFTLRPGDRLCLYSDGITECENPHHEQFGQDRLENWLQRHVSSPLDAIFPALHEKLVGWRAEKKGDQVAMADDVSLLIIERSPEGERDES
ncbi:PP2C family protein-serine/threonine phosphatase [Cronobacter dublinensis]|uniref:PP2C family protein-serine/threonine phosphatase n=1 Tax=Cronobacter dublinensis TaxID=413497 RepID=UPI000CFAB792|nr:SpoIIE family protein phosphatase [Cronobacter dublinensis]EKK7713956.1 SpoIIE family protein phosphatase [Cronobacter dublinensis]ELY2854270.1 SpoIIE family protein phosphatase [Cronobacter dublinensis]ELY2909139.1 SpoIIE family protein phosphatase [Cronobacter dublinensis]ELY9423944.1 SpoIIE family protein phosphatase [Cronobacter dublinensis]MDI7491581.1 SpoIIE family protein phosphatase [Cronobacter dublinensis]